MTPIAKCKCGRSKYLTRDGVTCGQCGEQLETLSGYSNAALGYNALTLAAQADAQRQYSGVRAGDLLQSLLGSTAGMLGRRHW